MFTLKLRYRGDIRLHFKGLYRIGILYFESPYGLRIPFPGRFGVDRDGAVSSCGNEVEREFHLSGSVELVEVEVFVAHDAAVGIVDHWIYIDVGMIRVLQVVVVVVYREEMRAAVVKAWIRLIGTVLTGEVRRYGRRI